MKFIKAEVFGVECWVAIMAKDHPALQELFKLNEGEQLSPVLCLALLKDSQHCFYKHTRSLMGCCSRGTPLRSLFWVK